MHGTGNKRLICNLLSQHRWWSILHFAFMLTRCFKKRPPVCVNAGYSSLWTLVFAFCNPVHKNYTQFMNIFSTQCMHILSWLECDRTIFRILTFCYCRPVSLRWWLKIKNTQWRFLSKDKQRHHYTIARKSIGLLIVWSQPLLKNFQACNLYKTRISMQNK